MALWQARQYGTIVDDFRRSAPADLWDEMLISFGILLERGNLCGRPTTAPLGDGMFELRARHANVHGRFLFYFSPSVRRLIVVVHWVIKKTRRVDLADIKLAKRRRAEIERGTQAHGIPGIQSYKTH